MLFEANEICSDLEDVECCARVQSGLFICGVQEGSFCTFVRRERGREVEFETLDNEVIEFDLVAENVGSGPRLGDGEAMYFVSPFPFNVAIDTI